MTPGFPLVGMGTGSDSGFNLPSLLPQTPAPSSNPFDISGALGKAGKAVGGTMSKAYNAVAGNSFLGLLFGSDYQYLTGIIGILLIIAGIFLFRPVRETVVSAAKTGAKVAAAA